MIMTLAEARKQAGARLRAAGMENWALEAELLLAHAISRGKEYALAHGEEKITAADLRRFFNYIRRRENNEPAAYITGHKEFYGLDFKTRRGALVPRPETEIIIDAILSLNPLPKVIFDIGTGCGAIAVTLAKLLPRARVYASDTSEAALRLARKHARRHGVKIILKKGGLLAPWKDALIPPFVITANLPYLPASDWNKLQPEIKKYEPKSALIGGKDGLYYYRKLITELRAASYGARVTQLYECDPRNCGKLTKLVKKTFPRSVIKIHNDLSGLHRVVHVET